MPSFPGRYVEIGNKRTAAVVATASLAATSTELTFKFFATSSGGIEMTDTTAASAAAPKRFSYPSTSGLAASRTFSITRVNMMLQDGSIRASGFGGLATGLANGIRIGIYSSSTVSSTATPDVKDFLDSQYIKKHNQFTYLAGVDVIPTSTVAASDGFIPIRWTIAKAGAPLTMTSGQQFRFVIRDNLAAITEFRAMLQGVLRSTT